MVYDEVNRITNYYFASYNLSVYNIEDDGKYVEEEGEIEEEGDNEDYKEEEKTDDNKEKKEEEEKEEEEDTGLDSTSLAFIISGSILGFIVIILSLLFIIKYIKKKNQKIDFNEETEKIMNENLIIP